MDVPTVPASELVNEDRTDRRKRSGYDVRVMKEDEMPKGCKFPYSMAIERNARRLRTQIRNGEFVPGRDKPGYVRKVETKEEARLKRAEAIQLARRMCDIAVKIQEALMSDNEKGPNESLALALLRVIYNLPTTPLSVQYSPTMLLTLKKCKNYERNLQIQLLARKAYDRCKAMFPFPWESSFEAVYVDRIKEMAASELKDFDMTGVIDALEECMFDDDPIDHYDD